MYDLRPERLSSAHSSAHFFPFSQVTSNTFMAYSRTLLSCCILSCSPWYRLLPENQMQWEVGSSSVPVCLHPSLPLHWMNSAYHFCASLSQEPLRSRHVISQWNKPRFQGYYICDLSSCHMPPAFSLTIPLDGIMTIIPQTCWIFFHIPELLLWPCILLQFLPQLWALYYRSISQSKQQQKSGLAVFTTFSHSLFWSPSTQSLIPGMLLQLLFSSLQLQPIAISSHSQPHYIQPLRPLGITFYFLCVTVMTTCSSDFPPSHQLLTQSLARCWSSEYLNVGIIRWSSTPLPDSLGSFHSFTLSTLKFSKLISLIENYVFTFLWTIST